jgi:uncharacterized membrane protein
VKCFLALSVEDHWSKRFYIVTVLKRLSFFDLYLCHRLVFNFVYSFIFMRYLSRIDI